MTGRAMTKVVPCFFPAPEGERALVRFHDAFSQCTCRDPCRRSWKAKRTARTGAFAPRRSLPMPEVRQLEIDRLARAPPRYMVRLAAVRHGLARIVRQVEEGPEHPLLVQEHRPRHIHVGHDFDPARAKALLHRFQQGVDEFRDGDDGNVSGGFRRGNSPEVRWRAG